MVQQIVFVGGVPRVQFTLMDQFLMFLFLIKPSLSPCLSGSRASSGTYQQTPVTRPSGSRYVPKG